MKKNVRKNEINDIQICWDLHVSQIDSTEIDFEGSWRKKNQNNGKTNKCVNAKPKGKKYVKYENFQNSLKIIRMKNETKEMKGFG